MLSLDGFATFILKIGQMGASSNHEKIPPHQCAEFSGIDYEDRAACRSPRGDASFVAYDSGRDVNYADREFDLDDLVLSVLCLALEEAPSWGEGSDGNGR
jgi:hypothetical protein